MQQRLTALAEAKLFAQNHSDLYDARLLLLEIKVGKTNFIGLAFTLTLSMVGAALAGDVDPETVPVAKQTMAKNYLSAKEAAAMKESLGAKALMIDVRTPAELEYVGMADSVDKNIPYMMDDYTEWDDKKSRYMMAPNSGFLSTMTDSVKNLNLSKDDVVIVICRSGDRSSQAANLLTNAGYKRVYSVVDGFEGDMAKDGVNKGRRAVNGWKNAGLPWSYNLIKNKMFIQ